MDILGNGPKLFLNLSLSLSPTNNAIDHFLFIRPFSGPSLLITSLLLHMLIISRMAFAQIIVTSKMQALASHFGW